MKQRFFCILLLLSLATLASSHFVFVVPQASGASAQVFLSENLKPTDEVDAGIVSETKLNLRDAQGGETPLTLVKGHHAYTAALPGGGLRLIYGVADLGRMQAGQGKSYHLVYYPKTILGDAFDPKEIVGAETPLEIVPTGEPGALRLRVLAHGKPQSKSEVTVILPDATQKKLMTDDTGLTDVLTQTGRYGAWARYWKAETRNYATLVFDVPTRSPVTSESAPPVTAKRFGTLPEATASFGAAVSDGWLYVYGGHVARTHSYSTNAVSGEFARLKLSDGVTWQQLPNGPALQGMNLAAYNGKIYRIGGMAPRNQPGKKEAMYSVADCARFDPATMKWESLPPLPEPRSSHDFAVVGDKLIVTGGWTLAGSAGEHWLDTLEVLDLSAGKLEWKSTRQPFQRRALMAASFSGKMYVLGGMDDHGTISHQVDIYDPKSHLWTNGPLLPGGEIAGFAPAACVHDGKLYVSIADGSLYRLNEPKGQWEKLADTTPRVAHRMVSDGDRILIMGGAARGRNLDLIESVDVGN
jgi:N-acetylneuraminic acid mutarotase